MRRIVRNIVFVLFFGVGAAVLAGTVLCRDLLEYYRNSQLLGRLDNTIGKLESLNADYDALLSQMEQDPNYVKRIAPATLGRDPCEPNTIYPRATADTLAAAKTALTDRAHQPAQKPAEPDWLQRCCQSPRRQILFGCGACLIVVAFVFFGPVKRTPAEPPNQDSSHKE